MGHYVDAQGKRGRNNVFGRAPHETPRTGWQPHVIETEPGSSQEGNITGEVNTPAKVAHKGTIFILAILAALLFAAFAMEPLADFITWMGSSLNF